MDGLLLIQLRLNRRSCHWSYVYVARNDEWDSPPNSPETYSRDIMQLVTLHAVQLSLRQFNQTYTDGLNFINSGQFIPFKF